MKKSFIIGFTLLLVVASAVAQHAGHNMSTMPAVNMPTPEAEVAHASHAAAPAGKCDPTKRCKCVDCKCLSCSCQTTSPLYRHPLAFIMDDMMVEMDAATTRTTTEKNFLLQMTAHHRGAVAMAEYELKHGTDFSMKQLAKSILTEQSFEIEKMAYLIANVRRSTPVIPDAQNPNYIAAMTQTMNTMMTNTPTKISANPDVAFAQMMLPHHQAAVDMAVALLAFAPVEPVENFSLKLIADQQVEIEQMKSYLRDKQ